jgi:hypothetical protein
MLDSSNLTILDQQWFVKGDNYILLSKDSVRVHNLLLYSGQQQIQANSFEDRGLRLQVKQFDLGWLYQLVKIPKIEIDGELNANIVIQDLIKQKGLDAKIRFDSLRINQDDWNYSTLDVRADSLKSPIFVRFDHQSPMVNKIFVEGKIIPAFATEERSLKNRMEFVFELDQAKARILEYFLTGLVSNTVGFASASGKLVGQPRIYRNDPTRSGDLIWSITSPSGKGDAAGKLERVATTINTLKVRDSIPIALLTINDRGFHLDNIQLHPNARDFCDTLNKGGALIIDQEGRQGRATGGIYHNNLRDFSMDVLLCFNNSLVMNTTEKDNQTFYGRIFADGQAHIYGPFDKLKLVVDNGKTRPGSFLALPIGNPKEVGSVQFISFKDKVKERQNIDNNPVVKTRPNTGGLDLTLNIEVTPDATAQIILDAQTGDVIAGQGRGNLSITYNPAGELGIIGSYEITKGQYFFTYQNLINKPFTVQPGGSITWRGNPYEAELDLRASYRQKFGLSNLVMPYIVDESSARLANQNTDVDVLMFLRGALFSPDISFDINIPNVETNLRTPVDLALRNIRQDKNELNRQVFALILLKQFLPSDRGAGVNLFVSSGANTLSEMLSKQLSMYITDLLAETMLDKLKFINTFQFDVDFNVQDANAATNPTNPANNSQLAIGLDNTLLNNRLRVRIGANLDLGNNSVGSIDNANNNTNYIGADFVVEYQLDKNGHFKLRGYNRPENTVLGRIIRSGIGLSYRQEFDLSDKRKAKIFTKQLKRQLKKAHRMQKKMGIVD